MSKTYNNRKIDKMPVKKSKEYLWKYIQGKTSSEKPTGAVEESFFENFFTFLKAFVPVSAVAIVLIVALFFSTNIKNVVEEGGKLTIPTVHATFEMTAESEDSSGVEADSSFTLKASENLSEEVIAQSLNVEPAIELEIEKAGSGEYKIVPKDPLDTNTVYNFSIVSETGDYSWSYQVKDEFKIEGSLPMDKATYVPIESGIEIYFSHEDFDFENIDKYFEILPAVKGSFEHHRKTLSFVPEGGLKEKMIYTVTLKKGLTLNDSEQSLKEDFSFQFETNALDTVYTSNFSFSRPYYEVNTKNTIALDIYNYPYYDDTSGQPAAPKIDVGIYKYTDAGAYLDALNKRFEIPNWSAWGSQSFKYAKDDLANLGTFEGLIDKINWINYIYLPNTNLDAGYYLFEIDVNGQVSQALIQVTDLSSYLNISLTDSIVWVNDLETKLPVEGASISAGSLEKEVLTDKNGIAKFETPANWEKDYNERESDFIKITAPDGKVLITEVAAYGYDDGSLDNQYWHHFSTDRSVYKPSDTVKYFGFVKPKNLNAKNNNLTLRLEYNWDTFIKDIPIKIENDNTFIGEFPIKNYTPGYYYLSLYQGDKIISRNYLEIADYVKPAYNIEIEPEKKAVFAGEDINFNIVFKFFDGTVVPNIDFQYSAGEGDVDAKTDTNGEVNLNFKAPDYVCGDSENYYCYDIGNFYLDVHSKAAEEMPLRESGNVQTFNSHLALAGKSDLKDSNAKISIKSNWIDLSSINYLGEVAQDRFVSGRIIETYMEAIEDGEYYDFINKKVVKQYRYEQREKEIQKFSLKTDGNGDGVYNFKVNPKKFYRVFLEAPDDQGKMAHETVYVYGYDSSGQDYDYYQIKFTDEEREASDESAGLYKWWVYESRNFGIGDQVNTVFANGEIPVKETDQDRFLFMQLSNGLREYKVQNSPYYSFDFKKEDVPNVYVDGIWFDGTKYADAYELSANYNTEFKKLNIEIDADKDSYKPGEEVSFNLKVTDKEGDGTKAAVNINLVDEAYYKATYENFIDPLATIYTLNSTGVLQTYDTHDNPLALKEDMGGKGGCFTGETKILMADGGYKAIKDIKKGDFILTKKYEYSSELIPAEVTNTVSHFVSEYLIINENLEVTGVHVMFINGKWDVASNIKVGDMLLDKDGQNVKVSSIRKVVKPVWVYNFEVKGNHTYFANNIYVHNDKGGGSDGVRRDFEDTAFFGVVDTDITGNGKVSFKLPDNVTSFRVIATAIDTENLKAGVGNSEVVVSLPFFTDLIVNSEYSIKDSPIIKFRSYGDELKEGDKVNYSIDGENIAGEAFSGSYYKLPKLELGTHAITLHADVDASGKKLEDALEKTIEVKDSRLKKDKINFVREINDKTIFELSKDSPTEIRLMDGGAAYFYSQLSWMYFADGDRLDQRLSAVIAAELFNKYFGEDRLVDDEDLRKNYQQEGLTLLPYSSPDLRLSALAVYVDDTGERYDERALKNYFYGIYKNSNSNLDEVVLSLFGLAGMNEPVLVSLQEISDAPELTLEEKIYIALGFDALGAKKEAMAMYEVILPKLATDKESAYATALGAVLAASLQQDKKAAELWDFVAVTGLEDDIDNLYRIGYIKNSLEHAESSPAKFRLKINGADVKAVDHDGFVIYDDTKADSGSATDGDGSATPDGNSAPVIELKPWESFNLMAFPGDNVIVSVVEGDVAAVSHYAEAIDPAEFKKDRSVSIERKYYVNNEETTNFREGDLIKVVLEVDYRGDALASPYFKVTDILPSGLASVVSPVGRSYYNYYGDVGTSYPYKIEGQELTFYWYKNLDYPNNKVVYYAKVVNPGEFYAEPARMEAYDSPEIANISEEDVVKIEASE